MTRTEFVKAYAARSGLSDQWVALGIIDTGGQNLVALPCGCGNECDGWAMVSSGCILDHLFLSAPEPLRSAYRETVRECGK